MAFVNWLEIALKRATLNLDLEQVIKILIALKNAALNFAFKVDVQNFILLKRIK